MIEIKGLSYKYPGSSKPVLSDLNLKIEEGEFLIVSGPSGCGKTTFCRCLNGLIPHFYGGEYKGEVKVNGLTVKDNSPSKLSKIVGFVFQNPENQLFSLTVERDIAFGLENLGLPPLEIKRRINWVLELLEIQDLRFRAPYELSGGQQQKVAIACVLAMQPKIVVFDEPTSFLDPLSAKTILETVSNLKSKLNLTIVMVEHRLELLAKHADRIVLMDQGKIVLEGKPREVLAKAYKKLNGKIGVPKVVRLYERLINAKVLNDTGWMPLTAEEMITELRRALSS
jgi:energy-coupling factor transporter ATP-binding protein EcfA2